MDTKRKNKGFTLIELLVVIAVIGMLASIVLVSMNNSRAKARDARRMGDLSQFAKALELYYDKNGKYPCGDANLFPNYTFDSSGSLPFLDGTGGLSVSNCLGTPTNGLYSGQIISQPLPGDPINQSPHIYWYQSTSDRQLYILSAYLEKNSAASANDGGLCPLAYEVGSGVGKFQPYLWTTPCD